MPFKAIRVEDDVFEGDGCAGRRGKLEYETRAPVGEALSLHDCDGLVRSAFDSDDALKQLKLALHLTAPALLQTCPAQPRTTRPPSTPHPTGGYKCARLASSSSVGHRSRDVAAMLEEGAAIMNWLTVVVPLAGCDTPEGGSATQRALPPWLLTHGGCVRELRDRARDVADEALAWDVVRDRFACHVAATHRLAHHVTLKMYVDDTLHAMSALLVDLVPDLRRTMNLLSRLVQRYRTLMPAMAEAARRARALQDVRRTTLAAFQSGLGTLAVSLDACHAALLADLAAARAGMNGLRARHAALLARRSLYK